MICADTDHYVNILSTIKKESSKELLITFFVERLKIIILEKSH